MRGTWLDDPFTAEAKFRRFLIGLIAAATLLGVFVTKDIMEGASALLLVFTAMTTWRIFEVRRTPESPIIRDAARIWALISIGFAWLALDEVFSIHEKLDELIHWLLGWQETYLSDRMDDLIVGVYGVIGVVILYFHRHEFTSLSGFLSYMAVGLVFLLIMLVCDVLSDTPVQMWLTEGDRVPFVRKGLGLAEEVTKLISEAVLLFGFVRAYRQISQGRADAIRGAAAAVPGGATGG